MTQVRGGAVLGELRKSLPWALVVGFPMSLVAASSSMWFAHSAGWFGAALFAPTLAVLLLSQANAPLGGAPEVLVLSLGFALQFAWCWLAVLVVGAVARRASHNDG